MSAKQLHADVLRVIEELMPHDPAADSLAGKALSGLAAAVETYEKSALSEKGWIACKDRLPPDGNPILFFSGRGVHYGWYGTEYPEEPWRICNAGWDGDSGPADTATHWQPIPEAPK